MGTCKNVHAGIDDVRHDWLPPDILIFDQEVYKRSFVDIRSIKIYLPKNAWLVFPTIADIQIAYDAILS